MRSLRTIRSASPARCSRPAGACPAVRGRSCRRRPWSRRARTSCRSISCRYPHARLQGAFAGVDQIHDGDPFGERADRCAALDGGTVHVPVTLVPLAWIFMGLAIDSEASTEDVGLDGFLGQIDPYLSDAGLIQIVHVNLNRPRPLHFEQE